MTKPNLATAPSLLDTSAAPAQTAPSLLSSLGDTAPKPSGNKPGRPLFWFVAIPLLFISVVVGAATLIANNVTASFSPAKPPLPAKKPPASRAEEATLGQRQPVASLTPVSVQAATIINDLPASPHAAPEHLLAAPAITPHDRLRTALTSAPAKSEPVVAAATSAQVASRPTASKSKPATAEVDERDVKLLTALVASTKEAPAQKISTNKTIHAKADKVTADSSSKDDGRNQDVVERKPGDSTAGLLKRCKKLGIIEGELCRWRICSERWDTDPACKANAQTKASVADTTAQ